MVTLVRSCLRDRTPRYVHGDLHADLGEVLEMRGHLQLAQRAFTVGLKDFDPALDEPDFDEDMCLGGRYRVRRALDAGFDPLDRAFENLKPEAASAIRDRTEVQGSATRSQHDETQRDPDAGSDAFDVVRVGRDDDIGTTDRPLDD